MATDGIRFDRPRIVPAGPPPPKPPEHLRTREGDQPGFAIEAATFQMNANLTLVQLGGPNGMVSAEEIRARIEAHVKQVFEKAGIEWKNITPEEAQAQISEGGIWSPEAVSKRILDFVKAFDTGDSDRRQLLRDAVEQGYEEAGAAWGDELPEISAQTMKLVRDGLDLLFSSAPAAPSLPASA